MEGRLQLDCPMSEYERTLSVEAPASAVFQYVSDVANLPKYLPEVASAGDSPREFSEIDPETHLVGWSSGDYSGSLQVDTGDVTVTFSEITLRVSLANESPSDTPTPHDEQVLAALDKSLKTIREHVEHAHHSSKANFM